MLSKEEGKVFTMGIQNLDFNDAEAMMKALHESVA